MTDILDDAYESDLTEEEHERLILISEHAIAPPLSPAARAVFESFNSEFDWIEDGVPGPQFSAVAAALRAAAKYSVPDDSNGHYVYLPNLLAVADELDAQA
jgi:hypothetical protein